MPKEKMAKQDLFEMWIRSAPKLFADVQIRENALYCVPCERILNTSSKTKVVNHLNTHYSSSNNEDHIFWYDLTEAFLASDIPLEKLNNHALRKFFEKYMDRKIPHPSTLRKGYVNQVYNDVIRAIREDISDNFVYFIVDEATDGCRRSIANFLIGALKGDCASNSHLLASKVLDRTNQETIANFVIECLNYLWPHCDNSEKVLVMLTNDVPYMVDTANILSPKYPNMIHFTCATHALNRIEQKIIDHFPLVNEFITNVKHIFIKAPTRNDSFKEVLPNIPLPPHPDVTHWGTWLQAVAYYDQHFEDVKYITSSFNPNESKAITLVQDLMEDQTIREDIKYINENYGILINAIEKIEKCGLSLKERFKILEDVVQKINNSNSHPLSYQIKERMSAVFLRSPGYSAMEDIYKYLNGTLQELPTSLLKYNFCINKFAYCPLSTVDGERSFSLHKLLLRNKRQSLTPGNVEKLIVVHYEYALNSR